MYHKSFPMKNSFILNECIIIYYFIRNQIPVTKNLLLGNYNIRNYNIHQIDMLNLYNIVHKIICHSINITIEYLVIQDSFYC